MKNVDLDYKSFQFRIADLLGLMAIVAGLGATSRGAASPLHIIPMLAVVYVVKFRILALNVQPWLAMLLYLLMAAAMLPYIYCCVLVPWQDCPPESAIVIWISAPISAFLAPSASFLYDVLSRRRPTLEFYAIRSLLETCVMLPILSFAWGMIALSLGWIWI